MPKIIFDDEPEFNNPHPQKRAGQLIVIFLILAFLMGIAGGAGALVLISENGLLRKWLGVNEGSPLNLTRTINEKLVVEESNGFIQTVKKISPAVVSITIKQSGVDIFGRLVQREGAGSGFIITSDGLIVTNKHVVENERATYTIATSEGKTFDATVRARDPFGDLAILKIEAAGLPVVELGDSDQIEVGQWVVAIGNAFGEFSNSVSVGVVSAKNRRLDAQGSTELAGLIQTDAAINPGNSGGPLVNLKGQVVGINTAIASTSGASAGVGFAIPVDSVKKAIESVRKTGGIVRPVIGIRYITITEALQKEFQLPIDHGALVLSGREQPGVSPSGPADIAGIEDNDIVLEIDGERIDEDHPLANQLLKYNPGQEVTLRVLHKGEEKNVKLKLGEMR